MKEIEEEAAAIRKVFPGLKAPVAAGAEAGAVPKKRARKGHMSHMSPEAREAASERMKAYWAERKAEGGAAAGAEAPERSMKRTRARRKKFARRKAK